MLRKIKIVRSVRMKAIIVAIIVVIMIFGTFATMSAGNVNENSITIKKEPPQSYQSSQVAIWHMDEGSGSMIMDSSGNGNDGTIYGATWINGVSGSALSFDGVDDYVAVPDNPELNLPPSQDKTFEYWIKTSYTGNKQTILHKKVSNPNYLHQIETNGTLRFHIRDSGALGVNVYSTTNVTDDNWHYIATVRDIINDILIVYVDGVEEAREEDITTQTSANTDILRMAKEKDGNWPFSGAIDEVSIWNRVLTVEEIKAHYEQYSPLKVEADNSTYLPSEQVTLTASYRGTNATNVTFEVDRPDGTPMIIQTKDFKENVTTLENKLPGPLYGTSAVYDGKEYVYIFGGGNSSTYSDEILRFNPITGTVTKMSAIFPVKFTATSAVWNGTHAFIFGGSTGSMAYVNTIYRYDPIADSLTTMTATLPSPRAATSTVWNGTHAFIFGGANGASSFDTILRYDPSTDSLTTMTATFSLPRHRASAVLDDQYVYIFGGNSYSISGSIDEIVCYNITTDTLLTMNTTLPTARYGTYTVLGGDVAYVLGGGNWSSGESYDDILRYEPQNDTLKSLNSLLPTARGAGSAVWIESAAYLFGGGDLDEIVKFIPNHATLTFTLPSDAPFGTYTVYATTSDAQATTTFEVEGDDIPPTINNPSDISYPIGATGNMITWSPRDGNNSYYNITKDGASVESGPWDGNDVSISVDGLDVGEYQYTLWANDTFDNFAMDSVKVTVYIPHLKILETNISTPVSLGDTVDFNITIENTFAESKDFLLVVQVIDSNNVPLLPVFEYKTIDAKVTVEYILSVDIPADGPTGTYLVQTQILTELPKNGGYTIDYINDSFDVS